MISHHEKNTQRLYDLTEAAEKTGLRRGMSLADARVFCPQLRSQIADVYADADFLRTLARFARRYCPWVGFEGRDGLVMDITGSSHLMGGEAALARDLIARCRRAGFSTMVGIADTRGAAWAVSRYGGGGIVEEANTNERLKTLPVEALRVPDKTVIALKRLGVDRIGAVCALPRTNLNRRFGTELVWRVDQMMGDQPEPVEPKAEDIHFITRMNMPEPIGLVDDVIGVMRRLLGPLCDKLNAHEKGAGAMRLSLRRVDHSYHEVEVKFARPMRTPDDIWQFFRPSIEAMDSGYGIDQMRLQARLISDLAMVQIASDTRRDTGRLDDLVTRLGNRVGLENITRLLPADSHIPERSFIVSPTAYSQAAGSWPWRETRPLKLFAPEGIGGQGRTPPVQFTWRRMRFRLASANGPERITPEWWLDDPNWRSGLRDYWRVATVEGRRLWMFYTPQNPCWFVQGEFP